MAIRRRARGILMVLAMTLISPPARAVKLELSPDYFLDLHLLLQPWLQITSDPLAETDPLTDFFIRRTRIILAGQVSKWVSFFMETDLPNWGKGGDWTPRFIVQDAYVSFDIHESLHIAMGMILPPFVHQASQGAVNLHTLDYHTALIKYPKGSNIVWRDVGLGVRGLLFHRKLDYRLSLTNGVSGTFDDIPRFTGRLAYNALDAEEGFFLGGTYLGTKRVLSFGAALDIQPGAIRLCAPDDEGNEACSESTYLAAGADIFLDIPLGEHRLSGQVDFVYYKGYYNDFIAEPFNTDETGMGLLFDLGYAIGDWEPLMALDWFRPGGGSGAFQEQLLGLHLGLNWWWMGHNANLKLDLALIKSPGRQMEDSSRMVTLQAQVFL